MKNKTSPTSSKSEAKLDQLSSSPKDTQNDSIDLLNSQFGTGDTSSDGDESSRKSSGGEDFAQLLEESFRKPSKKLSVGEKIRGKILLLGKEEVFVSTGTPHDGILSKRELLNEDGTCSYQVNDTVDLYVTQIRGGEIRLSKKPTDKNLAEDLEDAFDRMLPVQGRIVETCKGGVRVSIKGKVAFCPISQIDLKHVENAEDYVGKSFEFRITQFSERGRNIVVSRRKVLEEEREASAGSFLEEHQVGDVVQGRVTRLEKFGAFIELTPGIEGLVHISEIAWSRIGDPSDILQVGQEVQAKILSREAVNHRLRISLSIKQAIAQESASTSQGPNAGEKTASPTAPVGGAKYQIGQVLTGKVHRKEVYGFFVQLEPGVNGLLHKSKGLDHPDFQFEKFKVGDAITVQIGEIRKEDGRISLDLPGDPNADDWKNHQGTPASLGTLGGALGAQLKAALEKKK